MLRILFKKVHPKAVLPAQSKPGDAGFDLCCVEDFSLSPGETRAVPTGLVLAHMPSWYFEGGSMYLQIMGRSGLALKGVFPVGGVCDATYRGEIKVILHNGNQKFTGADLPNPFFSDLSVDGFCREENVKRTLSFKAGDRIAQLVVLRVMTNDDRSRVVIEETNEVIQTVRGDKGLGSTGF